MTNSNRKEFPGCNRETLNLSTKNNTTLNEIPVEYNICNSIFSLRDSILIITAVWGFIFVDLLFNNVRGF